MGSVHSLPDRIDKDTFINFTGEHFTEQLWMDYSRHDFMPKQKLICMTKVHQVLLNDPEATGIYEGGMRCGMRDGYGFYIYHNGDIYDGEWRSDERHGYGKFFDMTSGDVMSGTWVDDQLHGEGRVVCSSGPIHPGGHGKLVPSVGDVYEGGFRYNKKHGYGKCAYSITSGPNRGQRYEGEWAEGVRHGHGVCYYANKNIYDGAWVNDVRYGPAIMTYANGDVFVGYYVEGTMHGKGTFTPQGCPPQEAEWRFGDRVVEDLNKASSSSEEDDDEETFEFEDDIMDF